MSRWQPPTRLPRARGLTLLELLLAVAATAVIGAATASMLFAVARGTTSMRGQRALVIQARTLDARVAASLRRAARVLDADAQNLVLWVHDHNDNDRPDLSELQRLDYNATDDTFSSFEMAAGAADVTFELTDDFLSETEARITSGELAEQRWAEGVIDVALAPDESDPQAARLITYRITLSDGEAQEELANAAGLRAPWSP